MRAPSAPSAYRSPPAPTAPNSRALPAAISSPQYPYTSGSGSAADSANRPVKSASSDVPGPPHSCTAAMPSAAARRNATRCAAVRCARVTAPSATVRTMSCAARRTHPEAWYPGAAATPGVAASSAAEQAAEWMDAWDR